MKNHIPPTLGRLFAKLVVGLIRRFNRLLAPLRRPESVFTEIYINNVWGGAAGTAYSGGGSRDTEVSDAYLNLIEEHARINSFDDLVFVDLGCGDMAIGRALIPLCREFVGVDVVRFLIDRHRVKFGGKNIRFVNLDMISDELPDGDVCFVRQVFQHLSNRQIAKVLPKLRKYRRVYITEHLPSPGRKWKPNRDKPQGAGIRLEVGSGIDLTAEPFNIPADMVEIVLEVCGNDVASGRSTGAIRTVLYTPGTGTHNPVAGGSDSVK